MNNEITEIKADFIPKKLSIILESKDEAELFNKFVEFIEDPDNTDSDFDKFNPIIGQLQRLAQSLKKYS